MDENNVIKIIIGSIILLLVVVTIVTPILDNVTYTETADNTPTGYATKNIQSGTYTISGNTLSFNGNSITTVTNQDWAVISESLSIVVAASGNSFEVIDFKNEIAGSMSSIDINAQNRTWTKSGTDTSGDLGENCKVRAATGEIAVYRDTAFILDKTKDVTTFQAYYSGIALPSGTNGYLRAIFSGTVDNLKVESAAIYYGSSTYFLDPETATAQFNEGSVTEYDLKNYQVQPNPRTTITFEYNGETMTRTGGYSTSIAAPLSYIEVTNSPIESMMGVVPIIMIAGIIIALIGAMMIRRS